MLGRVLHRCFEFFLCEVCSFDSGRSGHFTLQLDNLQLLRPASLIRYRRQRENRCFGFSELASDLEQIVLNPVFRMFVLYHWREFRPVRFHVNTSVISKYLVNCQEFTAHCSTPMSMLISISFPADFPSRRVLLLILTKSLVLLRRCPARRARMARNS